MLVKKNLPLMLVTKLKFAVIMEALSIEEKAKAYDETIEKLRNFYRDYDTISRLVNVKEELANLIPEIKESEGERIRKEILAFINRKKSLGSVNSEELGKSNSWIAWLEKQGEQNPANSCKTCKDEKTIVIIPKFKVGDIVKHKKNPYLTYILKRFTDDGDYEFHAIGKDGHEGCTCFAVVKYQDEWELVEQKPVFEMKTPEESLGIDSDAYNKIVDKCVYGEHKPAEWSSRDDSYFEELTEASDLNELQIEWLTELKDRVQPQPKQEWSEEDEVKINRIVACLENLNVADNDILLKDVDWLKSLRPQNRWKPSDEQMYNLAEAAHCDCVFFDMEILKGLYDDLMKLREGKL